jgi:hypothetical protein
MKFKVSCTTPEEFDGELGYITVTNRRGRTWRSKKAEHIDNIGETMMIIDEYVNTGGKLNPEGWVEV